MCLIGKSVGKIDGMALTMGDPVYLNDMDNHDSLYVHLLRSPHAFAKVKSIEKQRAESLKGIEGVYTWEDVPDIRFTVAGQSYPEPSPYDRKILDDHVRYVGDPVVIIAAIDRETALKAEKLIKVEYEVLTPVFDMEDATQSEQIIHPEENLSVHFDYGTDPKRNIAGTYETAYGDMDAAFKACDVVVENTYSSQAQAHAMMETYRSRSYMDENGRLVIVTSTQIPFHVRRIAARALEMDESQIRVIKPRIGGGFGGKQTAATELYAAFVTIKTGRPAKSIFNRKESFSTSSSRHAMTFKVKMGATSEGIIKAIDMTAISDTGAYGEHAWTTLSVAGNKSLPLYNKAMAARYRGTAVYTNKMPAGALRGYGVTQAIFAMESAANELAEKLEIDPAELRLKNIIKEGETNPILEGSTPENPVRLNSSTLNACIQTGMERIGWKGKYDAYKKHRDDVFSGKCSDTKVRGIGMAITMQGSGIAKIDTATAEIVATGPDNYILKIGSTDMGTGCDTILMQMAAEALEEDIDKFTVETGDTDSMPFDTGSYASSTTYVTGNAVLKAAKHLKDKLAVTKTYPVTGVGSHCGDTSPPPFIAGFAEVEVDTLTGQIEVLNYTAAVDCGTVINTNLARIQVEGGLVQGIGMALFEDVRFTKQGQMMTNSFMQYKVPVREDIGELDVIFVPSHESTGPLGAKSVGEVVINTPPPAVAHAIARATGVQVRKLPITPEAVCMGMLEKENGQTL